MSEQTPADPFGSMAHKMKAGWRRFWALSWWWKGSVLAAIPLLALTLALIIVLAVATGDGDDMAALEARQEPTPTATAVTPTPTQRPSPTSTPPPTPTPAPTPTPVPEPPQEQAEVPPQEAEPPPPPQQPAPLPVTVMPMPVWWSANVTVQFDVSVPGPLFPVFFGDLSSETQCQYDDQGNVIGAVTTITVTPGSFWENWQGAPLTYTWSASNGNISGSGLTATWTLPIESGRISGEATLSVTDGIGGYEGSSGRMGGGTCE